MEKKSILIVTSKFPYSRTEADGGRSTVASVIDAVKDEYFTDILFVRSPNEEEKLIEGIRNIFFEEIEHKSSNKFERRVFNYQQVLERIINLEKNYDLIIVIHVSKIFGLEQLEEKIQKKVLLYPMFLSFAYERSGEVIPTEYKRLEKYCLSATKWIVSPSQYDKESIVSAYGNDPNCIEVIPRSVSRLIPHESRSNLCNINIASIGNIKARKQPLLLLKIFNEVHKKYPYAKLFIAGEIQDANLYSHCLQYINEEKLNSAVEFLGAVTQMQIAELLKKCSINVTASNLETFGRCVFEGMYAGLPTVVFDVLTCVREFVDHGQGICFANDELEFSQSIIKLVENENFYIEQSKRAIKSTDFISQETEKIHLLSFIERIIKEK